MSKLLTLPGEVRHRIYQYHFSDTRVSYHHRTTSDTTWSNNSCVAVFLACKQTLSESRPVFFDTAQINLGTLIHKWYKTFCCPLTNPKLIKHAYIYVTDANGGDLSRVIAALPNLKSLVFYSEWTHTWFERSDFDNGRFSKWQKEWIASWLNESLGREEGGEEMDDREVNRSLIEAWKQRKKSFTLAAEVVMITGIAVGNVSEETRYMHGSIDLATKVLKLRKIEAPHDTHEFKVAALHV